MTPIFKKTIPPPPPHSLTPNEQRKAVGLKPLENVQSAELSESRREHYEPLICSRCGGQIDRETMKCLYCLTEYGTTTKDTVKIYSDDRVIAEFKI